MSSDEPPAESPREEPDPPRPEGSELMFGKARETSPPTAAEPASVEASDSIPERIGSYRILGLIGQGGMGAVYRAEQQSPRRIVALKTIRGAAGAGELIRRFERESSVLAQLRHSGIAQVYESGVAEGVPFFAMEFVEGKALTSYAHQAGLDHRGRLRLLIHICEAVQHAHDHGVVHRDLKPENILVTDEGEPKVLDFGIARATNRDLDLATLQTSVGQILGTVPYMSPEQIAGDPKAIDARTDVYALGVIAYELLSDRLPLDVAGKTIAQAARIIEDEDPAPLSTSSRAYRGDVETIVLKALEKEPERRYQSVGALADDLWRYLDDRPILARRPSTWYQLKKFSRRNKALVGGVAGVIVALAAGLVATGLALAQTRVAQQEAELALAQTRVAQQEAQRQAVIADQVNAFLNDDLLSAVQPEALGIDTTMLEVLDVASERIEAASAAGGRFEREPLIEAEIRHTLGETYLALGAFDQAENHLRRSLDRFAESVGPEALEAQEPRLALARSFWRQGNASDAAAYLEPAVGVLVRELGLDDRRVLSARSDLASHYKHADRLDEAELIYEDVLARLRRVLGEDDPETLTCRYNMALLALSQEDLERAAIEMQSVVEDRERVLGAEHLQTVNAVGELASMRARSGDYAAAEPLLERVLASQRRTLGDRHWRTLETMANVATVHYLQEKYAEAAPIYEEALAGYREVRGATHANTLVVTEYAALNLEESGQFDAAIGIRVRTYDELAAEGGQDAESMAERACKIAELLEAADDVAQIEVWRHRCKNVGQPQ